MDNKMIQDFNNSIADHAIEIVKDDGLHRHLDCGKPGTYYYRFHITTWPRYLCISGDMGTFVFSRLTDMFEFHRLPMDRDINLYYWAEKIQAGNRDAEHGFERFSEDRFREAVLNDFKEYVRGRYIRGSELKRLRQRLKHEVLSYEQDGYVRGVDAAMRFELDGEPVFPEFYDNRLFEPTYQFVWCCHAIRWAIHQYDRIKAEQTPEVAR